MYPNRERADIVEKIESDPVRFLEQVFSEKRSKNPAYSMRAYAKFLQISPARLSQILSRIRPLTKGQISKISVANSLSPLQHEKLLRSIKGPRENSKTVIKKQYLQLSDEAYKVLSDVNASTILSALTLSKNNQKNQSKFLAAKLGLSSIEVRRTLNSLLACSLIKKEGDSFVVTDTNVASTSDMKSSALRRYHRNILERAIESIENQSLDERDLSSITLVLDPSQIKMAKQKIRDFRRELSNLLEHRGIPSEVYALNIQLFKLSK
jgi:hypothetical protein